jgi:hypothetical protein
MIKGAVFWEIKDMWQMYLRFLGAKSNMSKNCPSFHEGSQALNFQFLGIILAVVRHLAEMNCQPRINPDLEGLD